VGGDREIIKGQESKREAPNKSKLPDLGGSSGGVGKGGWERESGRGGGGG